MLSEFFENATSNYPLALQSYLKYCQECAYVYLPDFAISSFLSLIGTVSSHKYVTFTGLNTNLYIITVAGSAVGKDFYYDMMDKTLRHPSVGLGAMMGSIEPTSGNALYRSLSKPGRAIKLIAIDEIGDLLMSLKKGGPKENLMRAYLRLYSAGKKAEFCAIEYADPDKKDLMLSHPCVSIYGTSTEDILWQSIDINNISNGWLGRLLIVNCGTPDSEGNDDADFERDIPSEVRELLVNISKLDFKFKRIKIHPPARNLLDKYKDRVRRVIINNGVDHPVIPLLKRGQAMANKISTCLAIAECYEDPLVMEGDMINALSIVTQCLDYSIKSLGYVFDGFSLSTSKDGSKIIYSEYDQFKQAILSLINDNPGITLNELSRMAPARYWSASTRKEVIKDLRGSGYIDVHVDRSDLGKPSSKFYPLT